MKILLLAFAGGTVSGWLAGFLCALLQSLSKDLRDIRLSREGVPLPKDRVFTWAFAWLLMCLGGLQSAIHAMVLSLSPLRAALLIFAVPAILFCLLVLELLYTMLHGWLGSKSR